MVLRVSEIIKQNKLVFETEEERLAYEAERKAAYETAVKEKAAELKAKHAGEERFKNYTDDDYITYAESLFRNKIALQNNNALSINIIKNFGEENSFWEQFTYEEIIALENNGTQIPKEVLAWAHAMQDSDVAAYELDGDSMDEVDTSVDSANSERQKKQKLLTSLCKQTEDAKQTAEMKFEEFKEIAKKAEEIKREQENSKKDALKEISDLTKEWKALQDKANGGGELTESDQKRYAELGKLLNGKDGELVTNVQASADELQDLIDSMDGLSSGAEENIELGQETVEIAKEASLTEGSYKPATTNKDATLGLTGEAKSLFFGSNSNSTSADAVESGNSLIDFSNTLTNQLMMNQYASLYSFAKEFTVSANDTIGETKEVMGEDFGKSSEEFDTEINPENPEAEEANTDELSVEALMQQGATLKEIIQKDEEVGKEAEKLGEEAKKELEKIGKEQTELVQQKTAIEEEKAQEVTQETTEETPETQEPKENNKNPQEIEKAQQQNAEEQTAELNDLDETQAIDDKIEANNEKGLTVKEKLQNSLKTNETYDKFNKDTIELVDNSCNTGVFTMFAGQMILGGGETMTMAGDTMLTIGQMLCSNPFTMVVGMELVAQGIAFIVLGSVHMAMGGTYMGLGGSLLAEGAQGIPVTEVTGQQVAAAEINIEDALEAISVADGTGEETERTAAEKERREMIAGGASLLDQTKYFKDKSEEGTLASIKGLVDTKYVEMASENEANKVEATAENVVSQMQSKKAEYDSLLERKQTAEKEMQEIADVNQKAIEEGREPEEKAPQAEFSEKEQKKLQKLGQKIDSTGDKALASIAESLEKVEGLSEFLADKDETALTTIDYGNVAQVVAQELVDAKKGNVLFIFQTMLGLVTKSAGAIAVSAGEKLQENTTAAISANDNAKARIAEAQPKVEEVTDVNAEDYNTPLQVPETDTNATANENGETQADDVDPDAEQKNAKEQEKEGKGAFSQVKSIISGSQDAKKEADENTDKTKRDEKTVEKEEKNATKLLNKDQKKMQKILKETQALIQESEQLKAETETLQAQNAEISAKQQNKKPAATQNNNNAQGGLLSQGNGVLASQSNGLLGGSSDSSQDNTILDANNARLGEIGARFNVITKKIKQNQKSVTKLQLSCSKRTRKVQKLIKEKDKLVKQRQRQEIAKQKKMEKDFAIIGVFNNVFTIISTVGSLLLMLSKIPVLSFLELPGQVLTGIGTGGIFICAVAKSSIQIANGSIAEALVGLGMAIVQVVTSAVGIAGVGGAAVSTASAVTQGISSGLQIVSSSAEMAANIDIIQGKDPSKAAQMTSQIAGMLGAIVGAGNSFSGAFGSKATNALEQAQQAAAVIGAVGTVVSTSTQIATLAGDKSKANQIASMIGTSLSMAAAVMNLGTAAAGISDQNQAIKEAQQAEANKMQSFQARMSESAQSLIQKPADATSSQSQVTANANAEVAKAQEQTPKTTTTTEQTTQTTTNETKTENTNGDEKENDNEKDTTSTNEETPESTTTTETDESDKKLEATLKELEKYDSVADLKMNQATEVLGKLGEIAGGATQLASGIATYNTDTDKPKKTKRANRYDMKKGHSLIRKVKRRRNKYKAA